MTEPDIYAVISQKGGSGKTTLVVNLAVEAFLTGKRTLILDVDPQGSAATWGDLRDRPGPEVRICIANRLAREIGNAAQQGFECIVVDTAGHAADSMVTAARLSRLALIPCRPQIFDLATMRASLDASLMAQTPAVTVFTAAPTRGHRLIDGAREALAAEEAAVLPAILKQRTAFAQSPTIGLGASEFAPNSPAAAEAGAFAATVFAWPEPALSLVPQSA